MSHRTTRGRDPAGDPARGREPVVDRARGREPVVDRARGREPVVDRARGREPVVDRARGRCSLAAAVAARPFHVAAGALVAGLAASPASTEVAFLVVLASGALALAVSGCDSRVTAVALASALAGLVLGDARLRAIDAPLDRVEDAQVGSLRVHLLTRPRPNTFGSSAQVEVASGRLSGTRLLMRVARWTRWPAQTPVGGELVVAGRLRPLRGSDGEHGAPVRPSEASVGGSDGRDSAFAASLRRAGVAGELLLDRARATGLRRGGIAGILDAMRRRAEGAVAAGLPEREAALARGMVLGQDEEIDQTTRQAWRDSGLAHLLAVSGQNVMLLVALAMPLLALIRAGPVVRGICLLALVALYVPLAGAGPSLQRAGVMGAAGIAAMTLSRPASRWYALLLAAAATLALNPRVSGDPGWQLSFAAVAGILLLGRPLADRLLRAGEEVLPRPIAAAFAEGIAITFAATLATAPLVAYHFGAVPTAGLAANLLALPAVAPAMWLGMLKAALGTLAGVVPPADSIAALLGPVARVPLAYLEWLAEHSVYLPGGRLPLPLHSPAAVCAAYGLIAAPAAALLRRRNRVHGLRAGLLERAAAWRRASRSFRLAVVVLICSALGLAAAAGLGYPSPPGELTVRFLDVGQGDATLIQDGHGANVLFDAGPPEASIYRKLRTAGVRRLDLAVSTHPARDHQGGFHELIERMPIGLLVENGYGTRDPDYRRLLAEADAQGIRHTPAQAGEVFYAGRLTVEFLGPPPREPGAPPPDDPNPVGVAAIVSAGSFDLWLSADAESDAILSYPLRPVDAMKVSHHGSADPGLPEVLDELRPRVAGIEVGAHNTYGHPTPSTLRALARAGIRTYRTDEDGTVTLTVTDGRMEVTTDR